MTDTPKDALVRTVPQRTFSLMPSSLGEAQEIAAIIAGSDFAPKDYKSKPANVLIAMQMGADLGLKPMQALQNIAVINGRPSIYGDAALALAMDVLESFSETFEGKEGTDEFTAVCTAKRRGWPDETRRTFSIADAKAAKLWMKRGRDGQDTPWVTYPKRMLQWRARGFTLRDVASDRLLGLVLAEEAQDYPPIEGTVVSSAIVDPVVSLLDRLPEGLRDNIEKGFAVLNLSNGQRQVKINEYLGADGVVPEEGAQRLLDWLKDEYAKRKTGQARKKKEDGNAKAKAAGPKTAGDEPSHAAGGPQGNGAEPVRPAEESGSVPSPVPVPTVAPADEWAF